MTSPVIQFKRGDFVNLPPLQAGEPALTLDTFEFYIGINSTSEGNKFFGSHRYWTREESSTGSGVNLVEGTGNGSNYLTLKSPDSLAGITTYTFPASPEDGYFLRTNADGTLEWASVSAGASFSNAYLDGTVFTGISTFQGQVQITDDTQSTDKDTGALIIEGGVGIEKNLNVGGDLKVTGVSTFVGSVTFEGGTINLGDSATDNINVVGEFISNLVPNVDDSYDLGISTQRWRNANFSGISTFNNVTVGGATTALLVQGDTRIIGILTVGSASVTFSGVNNQIAGVTTFTGFADLNEGLNVDGHSELDDLNVSGVSTFSGLIEGNGGLDITGHSELDDLNVSGIVTSANLNVTGDTTLGDSSGDSLTINATATFNAPVVFEGGITGTISTATRSTTVDTVLTGTNAEYYPTFVSDSPTTEGQTVRTDGDISYNPSTNTLTVPNIKTEIIKHSTGIQAIALDSSGNVGVSSNLTVTGNLFVNGSTTQVNTEVLNVKDSLIDLAKIDDGSGNLIAPTSDSNIDVGLLLNYYTDSAKKAAVYWDDSAARIAIASDVSENNSVLLANAYAALEVGSLWVNDCAGQSQVISCDNGVRKLENITIDAGTF